MASDDFAQSFDARDWALAFVEAVQKKPEIATDEGTMIGWFANALMRGWDERERRYRETADGTFGDWFDNSESIYDRSERRADEATRWDGGER